MSSEAQLSLPLVIPLESLFQTHSTVQHQALVFSWAFFWERVVVRVMGKSNRFNKTVGHCVLSW